MAIYYRGKKEQATGYKPLTIGPSVLNPSASDLKFKQSFCFYKIDGESLELVGGAVFTSSNYSSNGWYFGLMKLSDYFSGNYTLDSSKSTVTGNSENVTGNTHIRNVVVRLSNDVLSFSNAMIGGALPSQGGAVAFDLFLTKQ